MTIRILTDSASDLPLQYLKDNHVTLFPLKVLINEEEYDDLVTISPEEIYEAQAQNKNTSTSQVSPQVFEEVFTSMAANKEDGIYIAFSSALSGTYSTANMILNQVKEEYPDFNVTIIDTKGASLGQGLSVMKAVDLLNEGKSKGEIIEAVKYSAEHMEHLFTVDDLDHLAKGGRLSKTSAFVGGLLNIKPLLAMEDGKLIPLEKHRGKKKILKRMIEIMQEKGTNLSEQTIAISHASCMDSALELKALIEENFSPKEVFINSIGAVIGSHVGPGTFSVYFINDNK